jgi:hypothetical protein
MGRYAQARRRGSSPPPPDRGLPVPVLVPDGEGHVSWSVVGVAPVFAAVYVGPADGPWEYDHNELWDDGGAVIATVEPTCYVVGLDGLAEAITAPSNVVDLA